MPIITEAYQGRATITFNDGEGSKHYYTVTVPGVVENLWQPSVTAAIKMKEKGALVNWAVGCMARRSKQMMKNMPEMMPKDAMIQLVAAAQNSWRDVKEEAANIGSVVHAVLEQVLLHRANRGPAPILPLSLDSVTLYTDFVMTKDTVKQANKGIEAGLKFFDEHHIELLETETPRWSPTYGFIGTGDLIARVDGKLSVLDYKNGKNLYPEVLLQLAAYQMAYQEEHEVEIERRWAVNVRRDGELVTKDRDNSTLKSDFATFLGLLRVWRWSRENDFVDPKAAPRVLGNLDLLVPRP